MEEIIKNIKIEHLSTEVEGADSNDDIIVTKRALDKISSAKLENNITEEYAVRLATRSGGCAGMNFYIGFDPETDDNDMVYSVNEHQFVIDRKSLFYLMGVSIDYVEKKVGSGFVFQNPNKSKTCGCQHLYK